jgi:hypothetical protein
MVGSFPILRNFLERLILLRPFALVRLPVSEERRGEGRAILRLNK